MRILTFTTLYPNNRQKNHGLFVEHRLSNLLRDQKDYQAMVVAPVPWVPPGFGKLGKYSKYVAISPREKRRGIEVLHPRYPVLPKVGMTIAPSLIAGFCLQAVRKVISRGWDFDLIDAHYFYPDGVAAVIIGRQLGKPVVITARGSDINVLPNYMLPRKQITWAARNCSSIITVCEALRESLIGLGVEPSKVRTLRNGVDLELFRPQDKGLVRQKLGIEAERDVLLSVGHLVENKGHHLVIDALTRLDSRVELVIVGEGSMRSSLIKRAEEAGVAERVRICGPVNQAELAAYYSAADVLVLASRTEGMANVMLESLACGTPVAATNVSGTPEVVIDGVSGRLAQRRTAVDIASCIQGLLADRPAKPKIRRYAEGFSWEATSAGQAEVFRRAISSSGSAPSTEHES